VPKYMVMARYTAQGTKGVLGEGGTKRRDAVAKMAQSLGGRLESFHFALGETDAFVILDMPDNSSAVAASMAANASGTTDARVVVLLTPEEIDAASKLESDYAPPGG